MKIHIPNSAFLGNIDTFLSTLNMNDGSKLEITTHPKWLSVHPLVVSMIAAVGQSVDPKNIICGEILAPSGHYLKRMGLFNFLGIKPKVKRIKEHEPAGRLIPLRQIKTPTDLEKFLKELVPLLHLENDAKHVEAIQHIFSELIRNVLEHARSTHGAVVCAQYFRTSNKIAIGVADVGVGLRETIKQSHPRVKDDLDAIKFALMPGVTGTTNKPGGTKDNAGFGLFLIKSIAHVNSNYFTIISGDRMYKLLQRKKKKFTLRADPFTDRHKKLSIPSWRGVAVGVDISLDQNKEYKTLLDLIYNFYKSEVKGEKKKHYKKPKFI